ncbi:lipocalin family protein [Salegentibacter sp. F188]|uniref:Lipocalin family protein n=1 Tax=Autumnicola patrickiae TaxID=3075591 RepID=A0ABU3E5L8_9FLAO|nr:lipocalin family protein [Salegentibacter sp. F188]MDT0691295.1 lipocalin family protein [Salegentibacter sp. F188]
MKIRLLSFLIIFLYSCEDSKKPYRTPENAVALISGDSIKSWKIAERYNGKVRMNMGPCFISYRQTFLNDSTFYDNNGETRDCGDSLKGKWQLHTNSKGDPYIKLESPQIPKLLSIQENFKFFKILYLSKDTLKLAFEHQQYGNKRRVITDILVREELEVGDRYYHH